MQTERPKWPSNGCEGLSAAHAVNEERMALTYEIAGAYEQAGDLHHALESFTEVYGNNVSYRNVNEA